MYKYAIKNYELDPNVFEQDDTVLSRKDKLHKDLFMRAYNELKESQKEPEKEKKI